MLLIITGTIQPSAKMDQLILRTTKDRLEQYYDSILFYLEQGKFSKIVFCENSNYGIKELLDLYIIAQQKSIQLELISFQGNEEEMSTHGKGYGEIEILNHVFTNSNLAVGETMFAKVTGRLKITNLYSILSKTKEGLCYLNIPNHTNRSMYDTRLYIMPIEIYQKFFADAIQYVDDKEGNYLEKVYASIVLKNHIHTKNFPRYPRVIGRSASTGEEYTFIEWKSRIKDFLSLWNFYGTVQKPGQLE